MKIAKAFSVLALFAAVGIFSDTTQADPIVWTLQGVTFDDGGTATGSFTYDAGTTIYSDWNISVQGFIYMPNAFPVSFASGNDSTVTFVFSIPRVFGRSLTLTFLSPLTNTGGTSGLVGAPESFERFASRLGTTTRFITAGSVTTAPAAVPEPSTLALLASGIFIGGLVKILQLRRTP